MILSYLLGAVQVAMAVAVIMSLFMIVFVHPDK